MPAARSQAPQLRIAVVNCNTSATMTAEIGKGARNAAASGTEVIAIQPDWGPESAEGYFDSFLSAAAVLDRLGRLGDTVDAVVMAGFGEHGREGARELLDIPVVDITEAGAMHALLVGDRFGVVTTLPRAASQIEQSLRSAGLERRCAGVDAVSAGVLDVAEESAAVVGAFDAAARRLIAQGADTILLGCAGFTALHRSLRSRLPVPVVDPVAAGVVVAEGLVRSGLRTSKIGAFAHPLPKSRTMRPAHADR